MSGLVGTVLQVTGVVMGIHQRCSIMMPLSGMLLGEKEENQTSTPDLVHRQRGEETAVEMKVEQAVTH